MRINRNDYLLHSERAESIGSAFARADLARIDASAKRARENSHAAIVAKGKAARRAANRKPAARALRALANLLGV